MPNVKNLIDALNSFEFLAFPRKDDSKKLTLSASDGKSRFFITRVACGTDNEGRAKWMWARGSEMRKPE